MRSKPRFPVKLPLTAIALAALTACTGVTVSRVDHAFQYDPFDASAAGGGDRQMQVVVLGNPFDIPHGQLEKAVIDSMQASSFPIPINFAINPENPDPSRPYRVVLAFNPDAMRDPGELCAVGDDLKTTASADGRLTLMGAFCSTDTYVSHGIARASDVGGAGSKTFDDMIFQLTASLFPGRSPHDQSGGEPPLPAT
ncbi:MAG: hypothetical protein HOK98_02175 [Rhodospirillaceae bacterium]|jgi:hypothetical protein|nr:hypothetical protein [Rhodospirillaceae bacterium]MBT5945222.1 hypothetical protein [Rhodospirillaceae bacterium]MBT6403880.1 hypothetical protein [Rhodospirillaceae bacterium]MBT6534962.1 hypothetical protein [Rhodospirillaceae bacterium]MBT7361903.1 hypothetical protein [Rhodospirillaceae bacterium]